MSALVLDEAGAALPGAAVEIGHPAIGRSETCTTDENGRFASELSYPPGSMWATLPSPYPGEEHFEHPGSVKAEEAPLLVLEFRVPGEVGFDLVLPAACEGRRLCAWPLGAGQQPMLEPLRYPRGVPVRVPLPGERHRGRFTRRSGTSTSSPPDQLLLGSIDGLWGGAVAASAPYEGPYSISVRARGVVELKLRADPSLGIGEAADSDVVVTLTPQPPMDRDARPFTTFAHHAMTTRIGWVVPGRWTVATTSDYFEPVLAEITVVPGAVRSLELALGPPVKTGTITLVIEDRRDELPGPGADEAMRSVWARVRGVGDSRYEHQVADKDTGCAMFPRQIFRRSERGGRAFFEADIEEVPEGDYRIEVLTGNRGYDPASRVVRPGQSAELVLRPRGFDVHAFDAETSQPIDNVSIVDQQTGRVFQPGYRGRIPATETDLGRWCATAPGYRPAYGYSGEIEVGETGPRIELALQRGWGLQLSLAYEDWSEAAHVRVRFGGKEFVASRLGRVLLTSPTTPSNCILEIVGHAILEDEETTIALDGSFDPDARELFAIIRACSPDR